MSDETLHDELTDVDKVIVELRRIGDELRAIRRELQVGVSDE
ncbi:hypothetical protein ACIGG9_11640 [Pseudonocardia alni]